jgi:hypothetical protein
MVRVGGLKRLQGDLERVMNLIKRVRIDQIDKAINTLDGKWPGLGKHDTLGHAAGIYFSFDGRSAPIPPLCTRAEFEARKAERQNKPSWKDAPCWAVDIRDRYGKLHYTDGKYYCQEVDNSARWCAFYSVSEFPVVSVRPEKADAAFKRLVETWPLTVAFGMSFPKGESAESAASDTAVTGMTRKEFAEHVRKRFDAWGDQVCAKMFPETKLGSPADWYDYERLTATQYPNRGVTVQAFYGPNDGTGRWIKCFVVGNSDKGELVLQHVGLEQSVSYLFCEHELHKIRPLDWDRLSSKPEPDLSPELSFHLSNAFNELQAGARLLPEDDARKQVLVSLANGVSVMREGV